jgi:hypothetical protein
METDEIEIGRVYRIRFHGITLATAVATCVPHDQSNNGVRVRLLNDVSTGEEEELLATSEVVIAEDQVLSLAATS